MSTENRKIKILGIAPYEAMKNTMDRLAKDQDEIELCCYVGDLNEGLEQINRHLNHSYDVIISRGGTAEMIRQTVHIPVIDIELSVYDILRTIRLAESYSKKFAIIGFPNITNNAHILCGLLQYQIQILTVHNESEVYTAIDSARSNGCTLILCDNITQNVAHRLNVDSILFSSGVESINDAFHRAVSVYRNYSGILEETRFLREVLRESGTDTVIISQYGDVYFSAWGNEYEDTILNVLRNEIPQALMTDGRKIFRTINNALYSIQSNIFHFRGEKYICFYFTTSKVPLATGKYGIHFHNSEDAIRDYQKSFYGITGAIGSLRYTMEELYKSNAPILIYGEAGTGKEQIARMLYTNSTLKNNPLVNINCRQLGSKGWHFLTDHYNSPLYDKQNTIYFQELEALTQEQANELLTIISDMKLEKHNHLIFSCTTGDNGSLPANALSFHRTLSFIKLYLPPMRERIEELAPLANNYLIVLNEQLNKQILGFEPKALDFLESYYWPLNYSQFKNVLFQLATITNTPYIVANKTASILEQERALHTLHSLSSMSIHSRQSPELLHTPELLSDSLSELTAEAATLTKLNAQIIRNTLALNNGNQSKTAKMLGISRTTLWRYLKKNTPMP